MSNVTMQFYLSYYFNYRRQTFETILYNVTCVVSISTKIFILNKKAQDNFQQPINKVNKNTKYNSKALTSFSGAVAAVVCSSCAAGVFSSRLVCSLEGLTLPPGPVGLGEEAGHCASSNHSPGTSLHLPRSTFQRLKENTTFVPFSYITVFRNSGALFARTKGHKLQNKVLY